MKLFMIYWIKDSCNIKVSDFVLKDSKNFFRIYNYILFIYKSETYIIDFIFINNFNIKIKWQYFLYTNSIFYKDNLSYNFIKQSIYINGL